MPIPTNLRLHRPSTVSEALGLLDEYGDDGVVYAGGTELIVLLKLGLAKQRHLIDVKAIPGFRGIDLVGGSSLRIGAAMTHLEIRRSSLVASEWPCLAETLGTVGNIRVQSTGTLGGNLCFADPQSDPATLLVAAEATLRCLDRHGSERVIEIADFLVDSYDTSLRDGEEILVSIDVPPVGPHTVLVHRKVAFGERPDATCAVRVEVMNGQVTSARIVIGSVTGTPVVCATSQQIVGMPLIDGDRGRVAVADVARACAEEVSAHALSDKRTAFMRAVVGNLIESTLEKALTGAV